MREVLRKFFQQEIKREKKKVFQKISFILAIEYNFSRKIVSDIKINPNKIDSGLDLDT